MSECPSCGKEYSSTEGRRHHMVECCPEELHECPSCDKLLLSELGVKRHHTRTHGESISMITRDCSHCGADVEQHSYRAGEYDRAFCDTDCKAKWQSEQGGVSHPLSERVEVTCSYCGDTFEEQPAKVERTDKSFCPGSNCYGEWCSENRVRENNPRWGGGSPQDYGERWPRQRRRALKRDGHQCKLCGRGKPDLGRNPDVHHITPVREFDELNDAHDLDNLITLCRQHHKDWEGIPLKPQLLTAE